MAGIVSAQTANISAPLANSKVICQNDTFQVIFTIDPASGYKPNYVAVYDSIGTEIGMAGASAISQQTKPDGSTYYIANVTMEDTDSYNDCDIYFFTYKLV